MIITTSIFIAAPVVCFVAYLAYEAVVTAQKAKIVVAYYHAKAQGADVTPPHFNGKPSVKEEST